MPAHAWKPRQRPTAIGVVLVLHLAVLAGALRLGVWPERLQQTTRTPLSVQLIWQRLAAPRPAQSTDPVPAKPPPVRRSAAPRTADHSATPATPQAADPALQAITLPPAAAIEPSPGPAAPASAPALNLALPRGAWAAWRQRPPALDDARANTPKLTMEQKLAMAMGGEGDWVEEVIDADHRRMRRGNVCVYLQRPAAAQLDPFHAANRNLPWQAGRPTRCD